MRKKAFTLIELLVVIAIISLLVSILLPSLNSARELAKNVSCMSNMRNLGMSVFMYLEDNNQTYPLGYTASGGWVNQLTPYDTEMREIFHYYANPSREYNNATMGSALCPSHENRPIRSGVISGDFAYNHSVFGYTGWNKYPISSTSITDAASTFLFVDGYDGLDVNSSCFVYSYAHLSVPTVIGAIHVDSEKANMLFAGGNVESRLFPEGVSDVAYDESNITIMYR